MPGACCEIGLANTDARIAADKPVTPTFLFAMLLWGAVLRELNERQAGPAPDLALLMQACDAVLKAQQSRVAIPRRFAVPMRELLMLQPRFNRRSGVKSLEPAAASALPRRLRFPAAARAGGRRGSGTRAVVDRHAVLPQEERVELVQARPADAPGGAAPRKAHRAAGRRRRRRRRGGAARGWR